MQGEGTEGLQSWSYLIAKCPICGSLELGESIFPHQLLTNLSSVHLTLLYSAIFLILQMPS